MSIRVANGSGTSFNTPANWDTGVNTPTIHTSTNITVTAGGVTSAAFTAASLARQATGVVVKFAAVGSAGTITATLQENSAGWVDVASSPAVNITDLRASSDTFFKFSAPYTFAALTAGYYRIKLNTSGASGTTSVCADSGGANFAYSATHDDNVVPSSGDEMIVSSPNAGSELIIDLDADFSVGNAGYTGSPTFRTWGSAITLGRNGSISWPTTSNRTVTCKGYVMVEPSGGYYMGTVASQIPIGTLARLAFDQNGVTTNYGMYHYATGKIILQGESLTYNESVIVSGSGTTLDPLVVTDTTGWTTGMELILPPVSDNAANYDETEVKFIRTIAGTSITLADTSGGAESGLTYDHVGAPAINVTRPVLIDTTDTTKAWWWDLNETSDVANINLDGCRLETTGSGVAGRTCLQFSNLATEMFTADDVVFYRQPGSQGVTFGNNNEQRTFTKLIFYDCNATGNAGAFFVSSMRNKRYEQCRVIDSTSRGYFLGACSASVFDDCRAWACGRTSPTQGGFCFQNSSNIEMYSSEVHANRGPGFELATMPQLYAFQCQLGNKGENKGDDVVPTSDNFSTAVLEDCLFGSTTTISNYTNAASGTDIAFHRFNQTQGDHRWYTKNGSARSTGASLADTTVRTSDSLAVRIAPESSSPGFDWQFKILARANTAVGITGFIQKNAAFGSDVVTVELYLPGLVPGVDTPSDSMNMPNDTSWNVFNLAANYTGTVDLFATVRIVAKSTTASAYVYVDDLYNGTNPLTALDVWDDGKPSELIYEQLGDAAAVWSVATSTFTTSGTAGYLLTKLLTVAKFLGLR